MRPIEIKRLSGGLEITWSDGLRCMLSAETLRHNCPCAACKRGKGDETHNRPLSANKNHSAGKGLLRVVESASAEALRLVQIWEVGNYAVGLEWGDGHSTGIHTFEQLRSLTGAATQ